MSVIPSILANPDADDPIDDDEVSHKHCNRIPPTYPTNVHTSDMQPGIGKIRLLEEAGNVLCV